MIAMNTAMAQDRSIKGMPEEALQLVPCRWSHTGWKYVQSDPEKSYFFSSPNRVNSLGFTATKNGFKMQQRRRTIQKIAEKR